MNVWYRQWRCGGATCV